MKILIVAPNQAPQPAEITGTLEEMQQIVGGLIDAVYPFAEPVALICNDEGKLLGMPLNRALYDPDTDKMYDTIAGTFFLCGCSPESDCFTSLSEEQIARYAERFHDPETFIRVGNEVVALPLGKETSK